MWSRWPEVRAALIVVHLFAISALAFPAPGGGMSRSAWKNPTVQAEFETWRGRAASFGYEMSAEAFEDELWTWAVAYMKARDVVLEPMEPYHEYMGTWQSWRMFVAPHRFPSRLHIDIEQGGVWTPIYEGRSDEHTWLRPVFDHDRIRSQTFRYGWKKYRRHWKVFGASIAKRVAADFPDASRVRLRYFTYKTLSPEQVRAGEQIDGKFVQPLVFDLQELP